MKHGYIPVEYFNKSPWQDIWIQCNRSIGGSNGSAKKHYLIIQSFLYIQNLKTCEGQWEEKRQTNTLGNMLLL